MTHRELWDQVDQNLYEVLGVSQSASDEAIQRAWHASARRSHPDVGGQEESFQAVHIAYLVLSDAESRRRYDLSRIVDKPSGSVLTDSEVISESPTFADAPVHEQAPEPPTNPRVLWLMALIGIFCLVMAYLFPWTTLLTGVGVGAFVMIRYVRFWRTRR